jgi:integrase
VTRRWSPDRHIGDFRKRWTRACTAIAVTGGIVHDLRRSGVKYLIETPGNDPHTVTAFSGQSTPSMLRRYHIIDLDVMRKRHSGRARGAATSTGTSTAGDCSVFSPLVGGRGLV